MWHDKVPVFGVNPNSADSRSVFYLNKEPIRSWYVNRITVVDIHYLDLYDFPVFEWIGPGFRDGRTDRVAFRRKAKSLEKVTSVLSDSNFCALKS